MINVRLVQEEAPILSSFTNGRSVRLDPEWAATTKVGRFKGDAKIVRRGCDFGVVLL